MEADVMEIVELELKYCERCGGLWLRPQGEDEVYCGVCRLKVAELPKWARSRGRPRVPVGIRSEGCRVELTAVVVEGGEA